MAHALEGARSIIGVRATRRSNRRTTSNIVWGYANATLPRQLRDILVTEYGIADLRGKSDRDVVVAMLAVADSGFQPGLLEEARRAGKVEPTLRATRTRPANRRTDIEAALAAGPARRPAARVPARHRDDRGRADAGRPAHVPEVGRLR
jgi:acyl-CoA hydrolase